MDVIIDGCVYYGIKYGGIIRIYNEIIPRLCNLNDELRIILITPDPNSLPLPSHEHISLLRVPVRKPIMGWEFFGDILWGLNRYRLIKQRVRALQKPIWHSTYYTTAGRWNGPVVVSVYDMIHEHFPDLFTTSTDEYIRNRKRKCIEAADTIICISETTRQELETLYNWKNKSVHVIPLAYSHSFYEHPKIGREEKRNKPFLLYVGGRSHYKNFSTLVQAYSQWKFNHEVDLLVAGATWTAEEMRLFMELGIADSVHLIADSSDDELSKLYNEAVAFVYPSLFEGFGIPLLEAMACRCPIVASNIPSTVEVAGDYPFYFEATRVESLVHALDLVLTENKDTKRMHSALEHLKLYSWDRTARETLEVYRSLC